MDNGHGLFMSPRNEKNVYRGETSVKVKSLKQRFETK